MKIKDQWLVSLNSGPEHLLLLENGDYYIGQHLFIYGFTKIPQAVALALIAEPFDASVNYNEDGRLVLRQPSAPPAGSD